MIQIAATIGPGSPRGDQGRAAAFWDMQSGRYADLARPEMPRPGATVRMIGAVAMMISARPCGPIWHITASRPRGGDPARAKIRHGVAIFDAEGGYGAVIVSGANLAIDGATLAGQPGLWATGNWLALQSEIPEAVNLAGARLAVAAGGEGCAYADAGGVRISLPAQKS